MSPAISAIADELGDLNKKLAPFKAAIDRQDAVRKLLREHANTFPANQTVMIAGKRWTVVLGLKPADAAISAFTRAGSRHIEVAKNSKAA